MPPESPDIAIALNNEAEILAQQGDAAGALARNLLARDSFLGAYGPGSPWLAHNSSNRGEYLVSLDRLPEAIEAFTSALSSWEAQLGPQHRYLGYPLTGIGVARWKQGQFAQALPPLERALRIREAQEPDAATIAETRFALARALWDEGRQRPRARALAQAAGDAYGREPSQAAHAREVTQWLVGHQARSGRKVISNPTSAK